jgi:C-methyltransferase C-terminal domain/Putative zinc binding domain/Methyltransferase domain
MTSYAIALSKCRICSANKLEDLYDFGEIFLTGVFLDNGNDVPKTPMKLIRCHECGLVQLGHSYSLPDLYGDSYGYESHLNFSMKKHLMDKAKRLEKTFVKLNPGKKLEIVVDIASNDGTFLSGYETENLVTVGIDPLISNFQDCYPLNSIKIESFFEASAYSNELHSGADIVTSNSVFYDIENPQNFAKDVFKILNDGGVWHLEQSYLVSMVETMSFDTVCQEHLLYLSMHDLVKILSDADFQIYEIELNEINGGSIAITAVKTTDTLPIPPKLTELLQKEIDLGFRDGSALHKFARAVTKHIENLNFQLNQYVNQGFKIYGLGASTKGNVLLQSLNYDGFKIISIGDINAKKFGKQTPGTCIDIIAENEILGSKDTNTICLILPWHFRKGIIRNSVTYIESGGSLLVPFPKIQLINSLNYRDYLDA